MSSDYLNTAEVKERQRPIFFPGAPADTPWTDTDAYMRYYLALPCYPFRTLSPRSMATLQLAKSSSSASRLSGGGGGGLDFDYASCMLPAHTQMSLVLKRRPNNKLLDFMLPFGLAATLGSRVNQLTINERDTALTFVGGIRAGAAADQPDVNINLKITKMEIKINSMVLQVRKCSCCCCCCCCCSNYYYYYYYYYFYG